LQKLFPQIASVGGQLVSLQFCQGKPNQGKRAAIKSHNINEVSRIIEFCPRAYGPAKGVNLP